MARLDRLGRGAVGQPRRLGAEARALGRDLQAGVRGVAVEGAEAERVQHRREGDVRIVRQRVAQRQRAMGGQLGHEPIRQRLEAVVLLRLRSPARTAPPPMVMTARWTAPFGLPAAGASSSPPARLGSTGASSSGRT